MDWFEKLTGFRETRYEEVRARLEVEGERQRSRINGASYGIGELELVSLQALRERAKSVGNLAGRLKTSVVTGDVRRMHGANAVPKKAEDQACGRRVVSALNELWDLTRTVEPAMAAHQIRREELSAADVEDCAAWLAGLASEIEKAI